MSLVEKAKAIAEVRRRSKADQEARKRAAKDRQSLEFIRQWQHWQHRLKKELSGVETEFGPLQVDCYECRVTEGGDWLAVADVFPKGPNKHLLTTYMSCGLKFGYKTCMEADMAPVVREYVSLEEMYEALPVFLSEWM